MKFLTIRVTEGHIRGGQRRQANSCPIALAIKSAGARYAYVEDEHVDLAFPDQDSFYGIPLSPRAKGFIVAFDRGGSQAVQPSTFRLRLP